MNPTIALAGLALGLASAIPLSGVAAQAPAAQTPAAQAEPKRVISKGAMKAVSELQAAVNANDQANIPVKLAAAQAVAKTPDERYVVAQLQLKAAAASNNDATTAAALEALLASGGADAGRAASARLTLAKLRYNQKQYDLAASSLEQLLAANPNNGEVLVLLAETRNAQGRAADAVSTLQRAIQADKAAGRKPSPDVYKRAVKLAYDAKLPATLDVARLWVSDYPSPESWQNALRMYRNLRKPDASGVLDTLRLARATNALEGDQEYHTYAWAAVEASAAGEAKAVIDEGIAAKKINPAKPLFKEVRSVLSGKLAGGDRQATLDTVPLALSRPDAAFAVRKADALYGYGEYARAAEVYRAALGKPGADADLINLRLGMALARAGDRAGAAAALNAVTGPRAELAKFWLVYLNSVA